MTNDADKSSQPLGTADAAEELEKIYSLEPAAYFPGRATGPCSMEHMMRYSKALAIYKCDPETGNFLVIPATFEAVFEDLGDNPEDYDPEAQKSSSFPSSTIFDRKLQEMQPQTSALSSIVSAIPATLEGNRATIISPETEPDLGAYQIMRELTQKVIFASVKDALYFFNGIVYELLTRAKGYQLIVHHCRNKIKQNGFPSLVKSIREFLSMEPELIKKPQNDTEHLAFCNGILNINQEDFFSPSPERFFTSYINVNYSLKFTGDCPNFDAFVHGIGNGNPLLMDRIWEMVGYLLTTDLNAKVFFLLVGPGNTGKSRLGQFIVSLFNEEACASVDIGRLGDKFSLFELVGKRINASMDLPSGRLNPRAVSIVKQLTGGDDLTAEAKYEAPFRFTNTCKLIFASNHRICLEEEDEAFQERMVVIPFLHSIPKDRQDQNLLQKFELEKLAIVKKALRAYQRLVANHYIFSGENLVSEMQNVKPFHNCDAVLEFIHECCQIVDDDRGTFSFLLFNSYQGFCRDKGYPAISDRTQFSLKLQEVCGNCIRKDKWRDRSISDKPENGFRGIVLRDAFQA